MNNEYKAGELEAIELLHKYGLKFNLAYSDFGKQNMSDLQLLNGNYIEVTHTNHFLHNDGFYKSPSNKKYFKENRELFKDHFIIYCSDGRLNDDETTSIRHLNKVVNILTELKYDPKLPFCI